MPRQYKRLMTRYIKAKDESKPHLMASVFTTNATLSMKVESDNISFPSETAGLNDITEVLIGNFNQSYENIYTICLNDTWQQLSNTVNCRWLVAMTEKSSGLARVGFGEYHWVFETQGLNLVSHLTIIIEDMQIYPAEQQAEIMGCFENLPYPWAATAEVLVAMSDVTVLGDIVSKIQETKLDNVDS